MFGSVYTWYLECLDYLSMRKQMEAADNRHNLKQLGGRQMSRDDCRCRRVFLSSFFLLF